jgi:hypothetical protein
LPNRRRRTIVARQSWSFPAKNARATATYADPCLDRSGADSPRGIGRGQSVGARVPLRWSDHGGTSAAPDDRLGSERLPHFAPSPVVSRYVSLRFTSRDQRRHALQEPHEKGTGGTRVVAEQMRNRQRHGDKLVIFRNKTLISSRLVISSVLNPSRRHALLTVFSIM